MTPNSSVTPTASPVCSVTSGTVHGHPAVHIGSDVLSVTVLPEKGADIYALVHRETGIDFLWKNPIGLRPPGSEPHPGSGDDAFLWNYEGGWQELFPSAGEACSLDGAPMPFHGEVATLPWDVEILEESDEEVAVRFSVLTSVTNFRLERVMRLRAGELDLELAETVENIGDRPSDFTWAHHCVLGEPFVEAGCELLAPARTLTTPPELYEETARLRPGQESRWPWAHTCDGDLVDLTHVPGRSAHTHDDVYLTDLTAGWVAVWNPRLGLSFSLDWDKDVFPWIVNWQLYGGAEAPPFMGKAYGIGIEPWVDRRPLQAAAAAGRAHTLGPGESLQTVVHARIRSDRPEPNKGLTTGDQTETVVDLEGPQDG